MFGEEREFLHSARLFDLSSNARGEYRRCYGIPSLFSILRRVGFSPDLNLLNILLIVIYFSKWVE